MSTPLEKSDVDEQRRHDLLNKAMVTAAVLQGLVEQVRVTTRELIDALEAGSDSPDAAP